MPDFDLKTIGFMSMLLTFMLSMLLGVTRTYYKSINGPGYWAIGNLVIGLGMISILAQLDAPNYIFLPGIALVGTGLSMYINGLQAFNGKRPNHHIPIATFLVLAFIELIFYTVNHDLRTTAVLCALVFAIIFLYSARLSFPEEKNGMLSHLYWATSALYFLLGLIMVARAIATSGIDVAMFDSFPDWSANAYTFMVGAVAQFLIFSLFVLMLNYRLHRSLQSMVTVDALTGVMNRRGLEDASQKMQGVCKRLGLSMSVLMVDIDFFKKVNDQYGHLTGDDILKHVARVIMDVLRSGDVVGRYGGEEFMVLMPNTSEAQAAVLAERIRLSIEARRYIEQHLQIHTTVSIGIASSLTVGYEYKALIGAADSTLYAAKKAGRNCVLRYSEGEELI